MIPTTKVRLRPHPGLKPVTVLAEFPPKALQRITNMVHEVKPIIHFDRANNQPALQALKILAR